MREYFLQATSFATLVFSEHDETFLKAKSPKEAITKYLKSKPFGSKLDVFAIHCWDSANAMHKGEKPLARWWCERAEKGDKATNPKKGRFVEDDADSYDELNVEQEDDR